MWTVVLLLAIGILSVVGINYIYKKYDTSEDLKKAIAVMLAIIILLTTVYMIFDVKTRDIALSTGESNRATLAILLGLTQGGYSPYIKESWGGTQPNQDFDFDGIKNMYDHDADNDKVPDAWEYPTRFNPFQPDIGIKDMKVMWTENGGMIIRAYPVEDITGNAAQVTLFINDKIQGTKPFFTTAEFHIEDASHVAKLELKVDGTESEYANKANNVLSYSIPLGITGQIGVWYSDLENEIQGVIRNNPLFYANNGFSVIENMLRGTIASVPLFIWMIILTVIVVGLIWYVRRMKKGKPPLFSWGRKKEEYSQGTVKIQRY